MGYFDLIVKCGICGENVGLNRHRLKKDTWICPICIKKCGGISTLRELKKMDIEDIRKKARLISKDENDNDILFNETQYINEFISIDENNKSIRIQETINNSLTNTITLKYSDLLDFEVKSDGETITKGKLSSAVVGGLLLGGVGAIVGSNIGAKRSSKTCDELKIKLYTKNKNLLNAYIVLIDSPVRIKSKKYQIACRKLDECINTFQVIFNENSNEKNERKTTSSAEEIRAYKKLFDDGIITNEEFEHKKKQLLGL